MALEVQVRLNRTGEEEAVFHRWQSRDYDQSTRARVELAALTKTEIKHNLDSIAFAFIIKATADTDTETVSMYTNSVSDPAIVFDDMFVAIGMDVTVLELEASGATTLDIFMAG